MYYEHFDFSCPFLWTVDNVFSPEECSDIIQQSEAGTWHAATLNSAEGRKVLKDVRDNDLSVLDDAALTERLWTRLKPHLLETWRDETLMLLGRRMRVYRYRPGQHFGLHRDQFYRHPDKSKGILRSRLTVLVYLNDDYTGGQTAFPEQKQIIEPRQGSALVFQNMLLHEGRRIEEGIKYLLRADVFYLAQD